MMARSLCCCYCYELNGTAAANTAPQHLAAAQMHVGAIACSFFITALLTDWES